VQMHQQPARNFLHGWNEQMDRMIEKMFSCKCLQCWKISVQCVREIEFFNSDITVIILHCQKLILYNWRPYLSITSRKILEWKCKLCLCCPKFCCNVSTRKLQLQCCSWAKVYTCVVD
jgi:hypothetical protein